MKRQIISVILSSVMLMSLMTVFSACSSDTSSNDKISENKQATIGNLEKNGWQLTIPEGALENDAEISVVEVSNNTTAYKDGEEAFLVAPIEISVKNMENVRLEQPVKITLKLDGNKLPDAESFDRTVISYWNGNEWEAIIPDPVRLTEGYLEFDTWHFSSYSGKLMTKQEQYELYAHNMAVENWSNENKNPSYTETLKEVCNDYFDAVGLNDQEARDRIYERVESQDGYGVIRRTAETGDIAALSEICAQVIAEATIDECEKHPFIKELIMEGAGTYGTGVQLIEAINNGDYKSAVVELADLGATLFGGTAGGAATALYSIGNLSKVAVEQGISEWKEYEMECAYKAYAGIAQKGAYGYSLNQGDWETLTVQMRGYYNRLLSEKKEAYRRLYNKDTLTDEEHRKLESEVDTELRRQFDERLANEHLIAEKQTEYMKIIQSFKECRLLNRLEYGYNYDMTVEERLRSLFMIRQNILDMVDGDISVFGNEKKCEDNLNWAVAQWLSFGKDRAKFYDWMREMGYLEKIEEGSGYWECIEVRHQTYDYNEELRNKDYWSVSKSGSAGTGTFSETYIGPDEEDDYAPRPKNGESAMVQGSVSTPPKHIDGGEMIQLKVDLSISSTKQHFWDFNGDAFVRFDEVDVEMSHRTYGAIDFTAMDADGEDVKLNVWLYAPTSWRSTEYGINPKVNVEVSAQAPYGNEEGDKISIYTSVGMGSMSSRTEYVYLWHNERKAPTE